jgi:hypothetical protein
VRISKKGRMWDKYRIYIVFARPGTDSSPASDIQLESSDTNSQKSVS